jgi:hypothetical protein
MRVILLPTSKEIADKIKKEAKENYGFNLEKRSAENLEWMKANGYDLKRRYKRGRWGKRSKSER